MEHLCKNVYGLRSTQWNTKKCRFITNDKHPCFIKCQFVSWNNLQCRLCSSVLRKVDHGKANHTWCPVHVHIHKGSLRRHTCLLVLRPET